MVFLKGGLNRVGVLALQVVDENTDENIYDVGDDEADEGKLFFVKELAGSGGEGVEKQPAGEEDGDGGGGPGALGEAVGFFLGVEDG